MECLKCGTEMKMDFPWYECPKCGARWKFEGLDSEGNFLMREYGVVDIPKSFPFDEEHFSPSFITYESGKRICWLKLLWIRFTRLFR